MTTEILDKAKEIQEEINHLEGHKLSIQSNCYLVDIKCISYKYDNNGFEHYFDLEDDLLPTSIVDIMNHYIANIDERIKQLKEEFEAL